LNISGVVKNSFNLLLGQHYQRSDRATYREIEERERYEERFDIEDQ